MEFTNKVFQGGFEYLHQSMFVVSILFIVITF